MEKSHVRVFAELSTMSLRVLVILGPRAEPKLEPLKRPSCWLIRYLFVSSGSILSSTFRPQIYSKPGLNSKIVIRSED